MGLEIRLATPEDARAIAGIHLHSSRFAHRGVLPDSYLDSLSEPALKQRWSDGMETSEPERLLWMAEDNRRVVGFCETGRSEDDDATPETAHVGWLYVERDRIGTGVGRALFDHAVEDLRVRGFPGATLWVFRDNTRARRFYESAGWLFDGTERTRARGDAEVAETRYRRDL